MNPSDIKLKTLAAGIIHISGKQELNLKENELVVLCTVRNAARYIQPFIEHYLGLGASHLVFLENDSTDDTLDVLRQYRDQVTVLHTKVPFKDNYESMSQYLICRFGMQSWSLVADIDEFFEFPFQREIGLGGLISYLSEHSYSALTVQMLDMFSDEKIGSYKSLGEQSLKERYCFYDLSDVQIFTDPHHHLNEYSNPKIHFHIGGIRSRFFGMPNVYITKHPFAFYKNSDMRFIDCHFIANARIADISAVFLHYKFTPEFANYVADSVLRENHWNNSFHYKKYARTLEEQADLSLKTESSRKYLNADQLVREGYLVVSDLFEDYVRRVK